MKDCKQSCFQWECAQLSLLVSLLISLSPNENLQFSVHLSCTDLHLSVALSSMYVCYSGYHLLFKTCILGGSKHISALRF